MSSNGNGNGKRGKYRAVAYYRFGGDEIVGLKRRPDGRFYAASNPNKKFGTDPAKAVNRFLRWKAEQEAGDVETIDEFVAMTAVERQRSVSNARMRTILQPDTVLKGWTGADLQTVINDERERIRTLILTDPRQAAVELDIEHLAYYPDQPAEPTFTLEELGTKYHNEKRNKQGRPLAPNHKRQSIVWWAEFVKVVNVRTVRQLTQELIRKYRDHVLSAFDDGKSPTYVKHRFGKVKAVFQFALDEGIDPDEYRRVIALCRILQPPANNPTDPRPIEPAEFQALLDAANVRQKAILLAALNFCMHSSEVAALQKSDIDLERRTLLTNRNKTGKTRIAVIWDRTADAIREYLDAHPHGGTHLFNSRIGTSLTAKAAGRLIQSLRGKTKLSDSVSFETIRDGAYTAAIQGGADLTHAKLLAGHGVGMPDHYIRRNPKMVADCCETIERHYFGGNDC